MSISMLGLATPESPKSPAADQYSPKRSNLNGLDGWQIPTSKWTPRCHPLVDEITEEVDQYFLSRWTWPSEKSKKKFLLAGFSRVTCLYFPLASYDRIALACKLLAVLFLVDDELDDMSLEEGKLYNDSLIATSKGEALVDPSKPAQVILQDIWEGMRAHDLELANSILEPTFTFMRAQTDRQRLNTNGLGKYLEYREGDVGKALLSALMKFSMGLRLSPAQQGLVREIERNCSRHISVVNDIYSYEKELKASMEGNPEGAVLCTAVKLMSDEGGMGIEAAKRVLWSMVREWEYIHNELARTLCSSESGIGPLAHYIKGLEFQMSGNELWSKTTPRYHRIEV